MKYDPEWEDDPYVKGEPSYSHFPILIIVMIIVFGALLFHVS